MIRFYTHKKHQKTVLNFLFSFYDKILHAQKAQKECKSPKSTKKRQKHKNITKQKHKNGNKRTKIRNAIKKHLRGKKSLICLFAKKKSQK